MNPNEARLENVAVVDEISCATRIF